MFWEDLGIDALFVDEAQNFKTCGPSIAVQKLPKYLGGIENPSQRALDFAIRAHLVRQKNGGSGVYLLSATPAKNSPLEYFSLLSLVDGMPGRGLGLRTPRTSSRGISRSKKAGSRHGSGRGLARGCDRVSEPPELKDILFRFSEFRTAQEVGLLLPKSDPQTIKVPMGTEQAKVHEGLLNNYRYLITDRSAGARNRLKRWVPSCRCLWCRSIRAPYAASQRRDGQEQLESGDGNQLAQAGIHRVRSDEEAALRTHHHLWRAVAFTTGCASCSCKRGSARAHRHPSTQRRPRPRCAGK